MTEKYFFDVPYTSSLKKKEGWSSDKSGDQKYYVFRFHFMLAGRQFNPLTIKRGEMVAPYSSEEGWVRKITDTTEWEYTDVDMQESVEEALREEESMLELASELGGKLGAGPLAEIKSQLKSVDQEKFRESFRSTFTVSTTRSTRIKRTLADELQTMPKKFTPGERILGVRLYKKYAYDLYLTYIDYLYVVYTPRGLRLRRSKHPPVEGNRHANILHLNLPLATRWCLVSCGLSEKGDT